MDLGEKIQIQTYLYENECLFGGEANKIERDKSDREIKRGKRDRERRRQDEYMLYSLYFRYN